MKTNLRRLASVATSRTLRRPATLVRNSGEGSRNQARVSTTQ
ncbi:Uncharacterised protein [Mycobacterium tuberculosis]|uniref:Uncharacterized protein n=1 Tax=Mycobacterium tuberculosis TaxID=1773 RepID=A0A916PGU7_MYCTX|nr:Uncharacterised protein [Mycobacterium tuberculosis]